MNKKNESQEKSNGTPLNLTLPPHPFDPTESVHEWTMWRAAVNRCIVNKVMARNNLSPELAAKQDLSFCLLHVPLKKFIHLGVQSQARAKKMSSISSSYILNINQFVYYGLPRPKVKRNISQGLPKIPVDEFAERYI